MTVDELLDAVIRREGGYVNHPADRGGPTKYGITQGTLAAWLKRPVTIAEVQGMTEAQAREIYTVRYLSGPRIDTLPDSIVPQMFDIAVNSGPRRAVRMLQKLLSEAGFPVDQDGVVGPETREAVADAEAAMGAQLLNDALASERANFYLALATSDPTQRVFLRGWLNRAAEFVNDPDIRAKILEAA